VTRYRGNWAPSWAPHAISHPGPGTWVAHPGGRLAVYRDGGLLWRSRIKVASDEVVVHGSSIAFGRDTRYDANGPTLRMASAGRPHSRYARRVLHESGGEYASVSYARERIVYFHGAGPIAVHDPTRGSLPLDLPRAFTVLQPEDPSRWQLYADWPSY